jgi:hypothetical protein
MCIFSGVIKHVANTKILVTVAYPAQVITKNVGGRMQPVKIPDTAHPLQLTVYSNQVALGGATALELSSGVEPDKAYAPAMVLPFPLRKGANRVKLLDLSEYSNIFEDLEMFFPNESETHEYSMTNSASQDSSVLAVHNIGSYQASIVPNCQSFTRLQAGVFRLSPDTQGLLERFYKRGYGFIVCQLKVGRRSQLEEYHPFAYCHELRENGGLFVPTRHFHSKVPRNPYLKGYDARALWNLEEGEAEVSEHYLDTLEMEDRWINMNIRRTHIDQVKQESPELDWDHEIYVINRPQVGDNPLIKEKTGARTSAASAARMENFYRYLDSTKMPKAIALGRIRCLHKVSINSSYRYNHDLVF